MYSNNKNNISNYIQARAFLYIYFTHIVNANNLGTKYTRGFPFLFQEKVV